MSETSIEWTATRRADGTSAPGYSFNIVWGCTKVSPACKNCYAEDWAARFGVGWGPDAERRTFGDKHWAEPLKWARRAAREGVRRKVFTSSMADVFEDHPTVAQERRRLWGLIEATFRELDWQVLTKRPERIADALAEDGRPADFLRRCGVWLMTTVEGQEWAERRVDHLLKVPAAVHGLSCEPLLEPVDLSPWVRPWLVCMGCEESYGLEEAIPDPDGHPHGADKCARCGVECCMISVWGDESRDAYYRGERNPDGTTIGSEGPAIDWVIAGGESGPGARPSHTDWFRGLRDKCRAAGVPYFFKQWGDWMPDGQGPRWLRDVGGGRDAHDVYDGFPDIVARRLGRKKAGRRLDGVVHGEFPEPEVARA